MKLPLLGPFPAAHDLHGGTPGNGRDSASEPRIKCHLRCVPGPLAPQPLFLHLSNSIAALSCFFEIQSSKRCVFQSLNVKRTLCMQAAWKLMAA